MKNKNALEIIDSFYEDKNECIKKKAEYFDKIANCFYNNNFGATNKSEIELLMFSIFMDEMIDHNKKEGDVLDYKACSDFRMSEMLGIPQEKVKNLKIKKQARYPIEFSWQKSFESIKDSIVYDVDKKRIIIPVYDPNLYLSIKNFIEEKDGYIEVQRGTNVLQMRPEHFFILLYYGVNDETIKKEVRRNFVKKLKEKNEGNEIDNIYTDGELADKVMGIGDNVLEFFESVVENFDNPLLLLIKGIRYIGKVTRKR